MKSKKKSTSTLKTYEIKVTITGHATVTVEAENAEEARAALWAGEGTDGLVEWEYDEIREVRESD